MALDVTIMAHPSRRRLVKQLVGELPGAVTVWDRINDRHETGLRCLKAATGTHQLIIQDDARPATDLIPALQQITERHPRSPLVLYTGKVRPHPLGIAEIVAEARRRGASLIRMVGPLWGVGVVLPTEYHEALIRSYEASETRNYDSRLTEFFTRENVTVLYTFPSLVDHWSVGDGVPSLVEGRTHHRVAHWALPPGVSALTVDWGVPPYEPWPDPARRRPVGDPRHVTFRNDRSGTMRRVKAGSAAETALAALDQWVRA